VLGTEEGKEGVVIILKGKGLVAFWVKESLESPEGLGKPSRALDYTLFPS
jgi:hypothetical protein